MALADYLQPHERVAVECGQVAATNLRLIHHIARSGAPVFRELPYAAVQGIKLTQRPRTTTVVLGALIAALSLLAGPGTPLQLAAGGLGLAAVLLGVIFGDLSLEISTATGGAKPQRWPMREVGRRESETLVTVARAWMDGGYDLTPETALAPLASSALARSVLLLPADDAAQTLAALGGNADVLCLDMTTLVHASRRGVARELVPSAVAVAKLAGRRVWVRVNIEDADDAEADLAAAVGTGLTAVVVAAESPDEAKRLDSLLTDLEGEREMPERVRIVVEVQSAAGVWALRETLAATPRVSGAWAATQDVLDMLGRPDNRATWTTLRPPALPETAHLRGRIAAAAMEAGVSVYACLATGVAPGGLVEALGVDASQRLAEGAEAAQAFGYRGAVTFHPEAIDACNAALQGLPTASAPSPSVPVPSKWQPVVPSHFGIGVPKPPEAQSGGQAEAAAKGEVAANPVDVAQTPTTSPASPPALAQLQPVVPSHFGIRVPPREPLAPSGNADGTEAADSGASNSPTTEGS